jgi:hypothetical protein
MIKSGAVIQNRSIGGNYPSSYNPAGRPGNYDVVHPATLSVFDTGFPKTVSPYQPRVAVSVEIVPKSVFKPRRVSKKLSLKNGDFWGQTALKSIFGGEENVVTNYMAQRLLGIVDDRMSESMQSQRGAFNQRQSTRPGSFNTTTSNNSPSFFTASSMDPAQSDGSAPDVFNLDLGEMVTADLSNPMVVSPTSNTQEMDAVAETALMDAVAETALMDAVAEVETEPLRAAQQMGIVQDTEAGPVNVSINANRGFGLRTEENEGDQDANFFDTFWANNAWGRTALQDYEDIKTDTNPIRKERKIIMLQKTLDRFKTSYRGFKQNPEAFDAKVRELFPTLYNDLPQVL